MFTGIVAAVGRIVDVTPLGNAADAGVRLHIDAGGLPLEGVRIGDSIALQGACMTAVTLTPGHFTVDVSRESLLRTVGLDQVGAEVNLEKALALGDALGGHLVSGHVDGLGEVVAFEPVGESHRLAVRVPRELAGYLAYKGSITLNGVSLTVNTVEDHPESCEVSVNLIPHTVAVTTLKHLRAGDKVNVEIDMMARYVQRLLSVGTA